jgi:hypothetical protein
LAREHNGKNDGVDVGALVLKGEGHHRRDRTYTLVCPRADD